ncbi:glycosyltransferase [Pseudalkalibacillus sp. R45]|uniref:glycosyltransferase n=1 Tax=Pseudalkalibacillus sp. R45 TaxID=3457433 RepID=UPI003FCE15FE
MKVVYLCSAHEPFDKRVYYKISKSLVKHGFKVISVHPNVQERYEDDISIISYKRSNGFLGRLFSLRNLYKKGKAQNPELVIAPEPDSLFVAYILKLFNKRLKVVFDCHEWYEIHFKEKISNPFIGNTLNYITKKALKFINKRIDGVLCVNETMKNKYLQYNNNSYCIPNTMLVNKKDFNTTSKKEHFIFSGNFCDKKQEVILLDAAKKLSRIKSPAKIRILGGFSNDHNYKRKFKEFNMLIEELNIGKNIEILPWMNYEEAKTFVNGHIAGITRFDSYLYGDYHCLPNKVFDYMSANLAVITCVLNSETSNIVKNNRCGIAILEETGEALADAIHYMFENLEESLLMSQNSYNAMLKKYNWSNFEEEIPKIIKNI